MLFRSIKLDALLKYAGLCETGGEAKELVLSLIHILIPADSRTRVTIDTKEFIETIERASLIITDRLKNPLRISLTRSAMFSMRRALLTIDGISVMMIWVLPFLVSSMVARPRRVILDVYKRQHLHPDAHLLLPLYAPAH